MAKDTNVKRSRGRPPKYEGELVHIHFVVPAKIRSYLEAAAYRKSTPHLEENENDRLHKKKLSFGESKRM